MRTSLTRNERIFIGSMDPRGIAAASTAASFCAPLIALKIGGANTLLPAAFLVIAGTAAIYGLAAAPLSPARSACTNPEPEQDPETRPRSPPGRRR
jgi:NhaP-type Na+/H+ or K+/H+ antiporter